MTTNLLRLHTCTVACCLLAGLAVNAAGDEVNVLLRRSVVGTRSVCVEGLPTSVLKALGGSDKSDEEWQSLFAIYTGAEPDADQPAVLGQYRVTKSRIVFQPRYPLRAGMAYTVVFRLDRVSPNPDTESIRKVLRTPAAEFGPRAEVQQVFPTRSTLPENQLKFYLQFSVPMSQGNNYRHVRLFRGDEEVKYPFLELEQELWSPDGKRFTLYFEPGRIKTGLRPNEEIGPPLEAGKIYTLVIDKNWKDAYGRPLKAEYRKTFRVGKADSVQPALKTWKLSPPKADSKDPLVIEFPEPLDRAMLNRVLAVARAPGGFVDGRVEVDREETRWQLFPTKPWVAGKYRLAVDVDLEDLAGNTIGRPFEVDIFEKVERSVPKRTAERFFEIR